MVAGGPIASFPIAGYGSKGYTLTVADVSQSQT